MADEERTEEQDEQTAEEASAQTAEPAAEEGADESAAAAEAQGDEGSGGADADTAGGEAEAEADAGGEAESGGEAEDLSELSWKQRRRIERSRLPAEARPQRSPDQRASERGERRRARADERRRHRGSKRARKGAPGVGTPPAERRPNAAKVRQGVVVSDRADKTITVRIDIARRHPVYEKVVRRSRTLHAHDEGNEAGRGDVVRIVETRPISRSKRWRLVEVLEKAR